MNSKKKEVFAHILNFVTIALIVECFLLAMFAMQKYAKKHGYERIDETTAQAAEMIRHAMKDRQDKLTIFADILAANSENSNEQLQVYMESFCRTQYFSGVTIERADGTGVFYGTAPHGVSQNRDFETELARLPYISEIYYTDMTSQSTKPETAYFYQAVPIIRGEETVAILYGHSTLALLPDLLSSAAYDGKCEFHIVDGSTGNFLMDQNHDILGNLYDGTLEAFELRSEYSVEKIRDSMRAGSSGSFVFRMDDDAEWQYVHWRPMGINNWSMQMMVTEDVAFAGYDSINSTLIVLAIGVIALMLIHVSALMFQSARVKKRDGKLLERTQYINDVQRSLLDAHSDPAFVERALQTIANQLRAETVMLLTFNDRLIANAYYWPSKDSPQAMNLLGRNVRSDFPVLFDLLANGQSVHYHTADDKIDLSEPAKTLFADFEISDIMLVPIMDNAGVLKGALAAVNMADEEADVDMLECVVYDFYMAITNLETHTIIKNMGAMDYLTGTKNRNSYESEISSYIDRNERNLWCIFVDVNGLHEVNNASGHGAGDMMLCAVADVIRKTFGDQQTYRLGGDEFVAFAFDATRRDMAKKKQGMVAELGAKGYYVSVGYAGTEKNADGLFAVEKIVTEAETAMYRDKQEYYRRNKLPVRNNKSD